jgi:hypothetical protein
MRLFRDFLTSEKVSKALLPRPQSNQMKRGVNGWMLSWYSPNFLRSFFAHLRKIAKMMVCFQGPEAVFLVMCDTSMNEL